MEEYDEIQTLKIGETVPDFELDVYDAGKKDFGKFKFQDTFSRGKWLILFFYPADYTFVCPTELADIGEQYANLQAEGAELLTVSTDTHFVHLAWQSAEKILSDIKYPMGADPAHKISKAFGVYDEETGLAYRGTFIINPDGKLVASEVNYYSVGRNSDELYRKLKAFKYVNENPLQVCPAKWEPGKKTLTPGKDLIGKVADSL